MGKPLCYLALGGNVGDTLRNINRAVGRVGSLEGVRLRRTSSLFKTAPQYVTDQNPFLNAVAELELDEKRRQNLHGLLLDLKTIEKDMGRLPGGQRFGPRVVDLDLLCCGDETLAIQHEDHELLLPHERMHERDFVLEPLSELCPDWINPRLKERKSVLQLLRDLRKKAEGAASAQDAPEPPRQIIPHAAGGSYWTRGSKTLLMGILNATPDSFSDGGLHLSVADALLAAQEMRLAGADIIDVGGESTRPGAPEVSVEDEIARVVPVIKAIKEKKLDVVISIDTRKAAVARAALEAGADWINDITAGEFDPEMLPLAAETMAPVVLMHMKGTPETMNSLIHYDSLLENVRDYLLERKRAAEDAGIPSWNIILDPGIGFAKKLPENLALLRDCGKLVKELQPSPLLISASRKKFLGHILHEPEPKRRTFGNAAVTSAAAAAGVDIVRVHDVREMRQVAMVADQIHRPLCEPAKATI